jgi:lysozyme family protein
MEPQATFLTALKKLVLKQLAAISLSEQEKQRLFGELEKLNGKIDGLLANRGSVYPPVFLLMINYIMEKFEGKSSNDKRDPGKATMFGLSEKSNPDIAEKLINRTLTEDEAIKVYFNKYYKSIYNIAALHSALAFIIFDAGIHGSRESIREMQYWANRNARKEGSAQIAEDGFFGPASFERFDELSEAEIKSMLKYLISKAPANASLAAQRVMRVQKRDGLEVYDYTEGFKNRLMSRYSVSQKFLEGGNLYA